MLDVSLKEDRPLSKENAAKPPYDNGLLELAGDVLNSVAKSSEDEFHSEASLIEGCRVSDVVQQMADTPATTLAGLKAKASVYIAIPMEALALALALDIMTFSI